jgi:hypothetical protein
MMKTSAPPKKKPSANAEGFGGAEGDRTLDLRLAKPALSQLSYGPMVGLRYLFFATRRTSWWAWADLNSRLHAYQACALTN